MRDRIMIVGRDIGLRARLARLLTARGYSLEIADGPAHARRIGFAGVALAIVASDGLGSEWEGLVQELRAIVGKILLVAAPGSKREINADLLDPTNESGLLTLVAQALAPAPEPEIQEPVLEFAGYCLDLGGHSLVDPKGEEISLTRGEFRLLQIFLQRPGRVLSRDQLLQILAGQDAESYDRSIDMQIVRLRRKIEADPKRPTLIVTIPGGGYKFAAKMRRAELRAESQATGAPREVPPVFAERGYVTALSAELVPLESDCLPEDPEDLSGVVEAYRHYASTVIGRHGGVIAERRAREVLAYFGYPVAREHAAETAVLAGLALVQPSEGEPPFPVGLAIRVALASGSVVTNPAGEVMGEAPGKAARLLTIAEPGALVSDEGTRRLTGELFEWADLGTVALKGAPHPMPAWRALRQSTVESRFEALRAPQLSRMVGRDEELALLLRRWGQARTGSGRAVLVSGEPGIGKSRLLAELEEALRPEQVTRLRYFCSPHHQETPLYPVIRHLESAASFARDDTPVDRLDKLKALFSPTHPPLEDVALIAGLLQLPLDGLPILNLSPQRRKERTFAALLRQMERLSQQRPLLMLFEDLHWADPSTREILDSLVQRLPELPVLVVMTFRPEFHAPWIGQPGVTLITLGRLDNREATLLAGQLAAHLSWSPGLVQRVVAQSDGVPLFIEELTKAIIEATGGSLPKSSLPAIPSSLQASLLARLDRLPRAKQVAQIGAVLGRDFSHAMINRVADLPPATVTDGLIHLVDSGLLLRRGEGPDASYTFKHALIQDAAYDSLLKSRRVTLHRVIAETLEQQPETAAMRPGLLGYHFAQADVPDKAFKLSLTRGTRSGRQLSHV